MTQDARFTEEQSTLRRARILNMPYIDTSQILEKELFGDLLSKEELYGFRVIPLRVDEHNIHFGITTTTSQQTMQQLRQRFLDQRVEFSIISDVGFRDYMKLYDPPKQVVYENVALTVSPDTTKFQEITNILDQIKSDDILAYLVQQSYRLKASDIHLESQKEGLRIRFRVDGVLHPIAQLTYEKYRQLLSSIAIAANISTGSPDAQTGHINKQYQMQNGEDVTVNLRVETVPTVYGVDVVMRLFNMKVEYFNIDNLGLSIQEREFVDDIISHPNGMVLVVGPTGSGKTTTLYSLINTLNTPERKIITLEDPVEYFIDGVVQIPVEGDKNQTGFAEKLRAVLRLDPDVVMLGEIRDPDTAKTALQAALTGHLVMSTFHAGSAAAALTRMLDAIGINPLFSSAMHLIMAQRLVRKLDDATKIAFKPDQSLKSHINAVLATLPANIERPDVENITLYRPGYSDENPFGYTGQIAIREQLRMTKGVQEILKLPSNQITTTAVQDVAVKDGMVTMLQDGVLKALQGVTSIEEIYRVVV